MGRTRTADGARITLENAHADRGSVVVGFGVQDPKDDRRNAGKPAAPEPALGTGPPEALPPHIGRLADEAGEELGLVGAEMEGPGPGDGPGARRAPKANRAVFALPEGSGPGGNRRFRFEVSLEEATMPRSREEAEREGVRAGRKPPIGPFVFVLGVPLRQD